MAHPKRSASLETENIALIGKMDLVDIINLRLFR